MSQISTFSLEIRNPDREFVKPKGIVREKVCAVSGGIPTKYCSETISELFMKENIPVKKCQVHRVFKIDKRNELLASQNCPKDSLEERVYSIYPSEYYEWVVNSGAEIPPSETSRLPGTEQCRKGANVCYIEFPMNGDVYKIDPVLRRDYQEIKLKPKISDNIKQVKWHIDDSEITVNEYPFIAYWKLESGKHRIEFIAEAANEKIKSNKVEITVLQ